MVSASVIKGMDAEVSLTIETEQEDDGRWIAEVIDLPGVMVYGGAREEAIANAKALALRVLADQIEKSGQAAGVQTVSFACA